VSSEASTPGGAEKRRAVNRERFAVAPRRALQAQHRLQPSEPELGFEREAAEHEGAAAGVSAVEAVEGALDVERAGSREAVFVNASRFQSVSAALSLAPSGAACAG
jgi:hypothetical protein